jgi:hypothetical protein
MRLDGGATVGVLPQPFQSGQGQHHGVQDRHRRTVVQGLQALVHRAAQRMAVDGRRRADAGQGKRQEFADLPLAPRGRRAHAQRQAAAQSFHRRGAEQHHVAGIRARRYRRGDQTVGPRPIDVFARMHRQVHLAAQQRPVDLGGKKRRVAHLLKRCAAIAVAAGREGDQVHAQTRMSSFQCRCDLTALRYGQQRPPGAEAQPRGRGVHARARRGTAGSRVAVAAARSAHAARACSICSERTLAWLRRSSNSWSRKYCSRADGTWKRPQRR